jgi:disulfide bond formation protein DsbB
MFEHLFHGLSRTIVRALIAFVVAGTLAVAYGAGLIWLAERAASMQPIWLLVASLGVVTGVASAGLVLVWQLAPAIAALRGLRYLADQAPEQVAHASAPASRPEVPALAEPATARAVTREQAAELRHAA